MIIQFNFREWLWAHLFLPSKIKQKAEESKWWKILFTLTKPFSVCVNPIIDYLFDSIFLSKATDEALSYHGALFDVDKSSLGDPDYRLKIQEQKHILRKGGVKQAIKACVYIHLGVTASIIDSNDYPDVFTIGETEIGTGRIYSRKYLFMHYDIYLQEELSSTIDAMTKSRLMRQLDEHAPSADYTIWQKQNGKYTELWSV